MKDAFHDYVVHGREDAVNPICVARKLPSTTTCLLHPEKTASSVCRSHSHNGSKARRRFGRARRVDLRGPQGPKRTSFTTTIIPPSTDADTRNVMRQAFAGLLWSKQFYHYVVRDWLNGDPAEPVPPAVRKEGRNHAWGHLYNADVISMPDKWEYPWYAAWDLAFPLRAPRARRSRVR